MVGTVWIIANHGPDLTDAPLEVDDPKPTTAPATHRATRHAPRPLSPERIAAIVKARKPAPISSPLADEIENAFVRLKATLATNDPDRVAANFDGPRTFDLVVKMFSVRENLSGQRAYVGDEIACAYARAMLAPYWAGLHQIEIRKVISLDSVDAIVVVNMSLDRDRCRSYRFWLRKSGASWKFYDGQNLIGVPRDSQLISGMVVRCRPKAFPGTAIKHLQDFSEMSVSREDPDRVSQFIGQLQSSDLPAPFQSSVLVINGDEALYRNRLPRQALACFEQALALDPEEVHAHLLCATCFNSMRQPRAAIARALQYMGLVGENRYAYEQLGRAHEALGRIPEAIEAYEKALADNPDSPELLDALARLQSP
jgi:hypothetical protein